MLVAQRLARLKTLAERLLQNAQNTGDTGFVPLARAEIRQCHDYSSPLIVMLRLCRFDQPALIGAIMISTRRFCALPASVPFEATGWLGPKPMADMRRWSMPWLPR